MEYYCSKYTIPELTENRRLLNHGWQGAKYSKLKCIPNGLSDSGWNPWVSLGHD